jgi:hypothetical protein
LQLLATDTLSKKIIEGSVRLLINPNSYKFDKINGAEIPVFTLHYGVYKPFKVETLCKLNLPNSIAIPPDAIPWDYFRGEDGKMYFRLEDLLNKDIVTLTHPIEEVSIRRGWYEKKYRLLYVKNCSTCVSQLKAN